MNSFVPVILTHIDLGWLYLAGWLAREEKTMTRHKHIMREESEKEGMHVYIHTSTICSD